MRRLYFFRKFYNNFKLNGGQRAFVWFLKDQKDNEWKDRMLDAWENGFYDLVGNAIGELKYNDISPFDLEKIIDSDYKGILKIILPIYKDYDRKLKQYGLLDYDDILILAHKALTLDEGLRNKFQSRYKYIFEDECQDSNEIQGKIIKLISKENNNLVRVGDVNQSITGTFSSSDPKYFKEFIREADNCFRMDMSNRSSKDIIDLANRLVKYVTKEFNQIECREALESMDIKTVPENMGYKENPKPDRRKGKDGRSLKAGAGKGGGMPDGKKQPHGSHCSPERAVGRSRGRKRYFPRGSAQKNRQVEAGKRGAGQKAGRKKQRLYQKPGAVRQNKENAEGHYGHRGKICPGAGALRHGRGNPFRQKENRA